MTRTSILNLGSMPYGKNPISLDFDDFLIVLEKGCSRSLIEKSIFSNGNLQILFYCASKSRVSLSKIENL